MKALDPKIEGNQRFIVSSEVLDHNTDKGYVEKTLPGHVWNFGHFIGADEVVVRNDKLNKVLGAKYRPIEESVVSAVAQSA